MKLEITPPYDPITEKEYCCVPAVLQMIQARRGLRYLSQDEIGYQLGLVVPEEIAYKFCKVRTGPEPRAGYGTQTSKEEFSISAYFRRNSLPLELCKVQPQTLDQLRCHLVDSLRAGHDVIICYNSHLLFGDGDIEHVSLIQAFEMERIFER